ncbi:hypothetical protein [Acetobacter tropicalis]|uniref:hypothetical protein n=1 Tax=Acetobacter tropicalis TaxID=104102 RepID=UPI0016569972|nr:hypothetical protein [Acetobacter tropicalis]MBC9009762.1 hypothetical protein [Acetobacter tropicalis]
MSRHFMLTFDVRPGPGLEGQVGALGEGVAYRQDKSREVRHGRGWSCGGFLPISGAICEVRGTLKPALPVSGGLPPFRAHRGSFHDE